jgi:hypothetical protein
MNLASIKNINGKDAYEVKVNYPSGYTVTNYYDVNSGFKLRRTHSGNTGVTLIILFIIMNSGPKLKKAKRRRLSAGADLERLPGR